MHPWDIDRLTIDQFDTFRNWIDQNNKEVPDV
jgi:hypothetical protein